MRARMRTRAARAFDGTLDIIGRATGREVERLGPLEARLTGTDRTAVRARMVPAGRVFGGTVDLELATATPVLPATGGLTGRGRGVVQMRGISFHARSHDGDGQRVAARLEADATLVRALSAVHFQRIRVEPDGRAVIRHLGGSLVWMLVPPLVRTVPLIPEQARATLNALEAFDGGRRRS